MGHANCAYNSYLQPVGVSICTIYPAMREIMCRFQIVNQRIFVYDVIFILFCVVPVVSSACLSVYLYFLTRRRRVGLAKKSETMRKKKITVRLLFQSPHLPTILDRISGCDLRSNCVDLPHTRSEPHLQRLHRPLFQFTS